MERRSERLNVMRGRVAKFSSTFGVGFIDPNGGGTQVLFTVNAVVGGITLVVGDRVEYDLYAQSSVPEAKRVKRL